MNVCDALPVSYVEALARSVTIFGEGASKEMIKVKQAHKGHNPIGLVLIRSENRELALSFHSCSSNQQRSCEQTLRKLQARKLAFIWN